MNINDFFYITISRYFKMTIKTEWYECFNNQRERKHSKWSLKVMNIWKLEHYNGPWNTYWGHRDTESKTEMNLKKSKRVIALFYGNNYSMQMQLFQKINNQQVNRKEYYLRFNIYR